jgi:hypothetical protein
LFCHVALLHFRFGRAMPRPRVEAQNLEEHGL